MYFPVNNADTNQRGMITDWLGYNHNYRIGAGEWYDMENLTSDDFPLMTPRKVRPLLFDSEKDFTEVDTGETETHENPDGTEVEVPIYEKVYGDQYGKSIRGMMLSGTTLCYMIGDLFVYGTHHVDLSDYVGQDLTSDQQVIQFGAYALIFPLGIWVNMATHTAGMMGASYSTNSDVTISISDREGNAISAVSGSTAPENPSDGDYWVDTKAGEEGLYLYDADQGMWRPVATTYIRYDVPGLPADTFAEGDAIFMERSALTDYNNGSIIQHVEAGFFTIIGFVASTMTNPGGIDLQRKIPTLDYVCADDNRVWGCHYGTQGSEIVNEIYACKLGDFKNWYVYEGLSTDAYSLNVGEPGEWTGAVTYQGYPHFFKENAILRIYGNMPSEYTLYTTSCRGVQRGSSRSLAIINEYLIYKSPSDVCIYDGSSPTSVSQALGRQVFYFDAIGGACLSKYYLSMTDAVGRPIYVVYDMEHGLWMKENAVRFRHFTASENGQVFAAAESDTLMSGAQKLVTKIYGLGRNEENTAYLTRLIGEDKVFWWAESGDIGVELPDHKLVDRFTMRAYIPVDSEISLQISHDDSPWEELQTYRGTSELRTYDIPFPPYRCDHYRIRLSGHGPVRVYSLATNIDVQSEEKAHEHYL